MANNNFYYSNNRFDIIINVVNKGLDILRNSTLSPINDVLVQAWQNHAKFMLKTYANNDIYLEYLNFLVSIVYLPPREQLNQSISKLLELARRI